MHSFSPNPLHRRGAILLAATLLATLFLCACARHPLNLPLSAGTSLQTYRYEDLSLEGNSDDLFVLLTFSGGGMRASALAYGVLEELAATSVAWEGSPRRLIDEVDVISAVSGGSFPAAYYCLYGDRTFTEFPELFLKLNVQRGLTGHLLFPGNLRRMISPHFTSSDAASEYYDDLLFHGARFEDLARRRSKPWLLIHATDMSLGCPFTFNEFHFALLCSDLMSFPISRAVAASSAFPTLLSPVTLRNFAGQCTPPDIGWLDKQPGSFHSELNWKIRQREARSYSDARKRPFIHLVDGGVADNLGIRPPLDAIMSYGGLIPALELKRRARPVKLVLISVNAEVLPEREWDRREKPPSYFSTLKAATLTPIRRASTDNLELFRAKILDWQEELRENSPADSPLSQLDFYGVEVSFELLPDAVERAYFHQLPTRLHLTPDAVDRVRNAARRLLRNSPDFQKLLTDCAAAG